MLRERDELRFTLQQVGCRSGLFPGDDAHQAATVRRATVTQASLSARRPAQSGKEIDGQPVSSSKKKRVLRMMFSQIGADHTSDGVGPTGGFRGEGSPGPA